MQKILVITTGGTIDKSYIETEEKLKNTESSIENTISLIRHPHQLNFHYFSQLDSRDMTDEHRKNLAEIIDKNLKLYDGFIVTHGTDTLVETASYLAKSSLGFAKKTKIILTGAMRPLAVVGSDGVQNLTESLFAFELLSDFGVFIVMHSQIYEPTNCKKNYEKMCFETIR